MPPQDELVHLFTLNARAPCGVAFWMPRPGTFHTAECLAGQQLCIGLHVTAVHASNNPYFITCPGCLQAIHDEYSD